MGKAARYKGRGPHPIARRQPREAHIDVFCPGVLIECLSVGKGDLKLSWSTPAEMEDAKRVIESMLRAGYGIYVETDDGLERVVDFNPKRFTYVIEPPSLPAGAQPEPKALPPGPQKAAPKKRAGRKREVPVAGSRATAVGRTSGG